MNYIFDIILLEFRKILTNISEGNFPGRMKFNFNKIKFFGYQWQFLPC